ncbi:MAG: hypothetical protein Q7U54_17840 [Bacteroidales bacterium]|nr:hypothetical protein [Bacteroidales bacterium]
MKKTNLLILAFLVAFSSVSSKLAAQEKQIDPTQLTINAVVITEKDVLDIQKIWGEGIVNIGNVFSANGDYKSAAEKHIDELYGYNLGPVLFKPTLASEIQFRTTREGALSYFIGHNPDFPEDHGFAIRPWSSVRWESIGIKTIGNMSVAMGNYFFTPASGGEEVKVEYTFAYTRDNEGKLRIIMHGSHLPYSPIVKH